VEIKITNFERKEGGIFEQFYYVYIVEIPAFGRKV
jgi:hypothetical protein